MGCLFGVLVELRVFEMGIEGDLSGFSLPSVTKVAFPGFDVFPLPEAHWATPLDARRFQHTKKEISDSPENAYARH